MKLSRRTNTIILWIIAIALLVGMLIMFTPTAGNPFASLGRDTSTPVLVVNNETITELEVARERQNRLYTAVNEGDAALDLQFLMLDRLVEDELLRQASARTRVSSAEVRDAVNEWRQANQVAGRANDQRYLGLLRQMGYEDATFRRAMEAQLRQQKYLENAVADVEVSDEEVETFYEVYQTNYLTEERIRARQIVVEDQELANELHARAVAGEDFAALAQEYSVERADRAGALGAPEGSTEPVAVGRSALPAPVATEAFALQGEGITGVVASGGRYYIVQVEEYLAATPRPFDEVRDQVREDALNAKRLGEQERLLESLRAQANITVPEGSPYTYENPAVATVGDEQILRADLVRNTYLDPQIQQFLRPDTASLITDFFKPNILQQLIDQKLAYLGAQDLDVALVGTESMVAQGAGNYVARDAEASEEAVVEYYEANQAQFTVPARAVATRVTFETEEAAREFRSSLLEMGAVEDATLQEAAQASGGTVQELGTVNPGDLPAELDTPLFLGNGFTSLEGTGQEVSDILVITEEVAAEPAEGETQPEEAEAVEEDQAAAEEAATEETATEEADTDEASTGEVEADEATPETAEAATGTEETDAEADVPDADEDTAEATAQTQEVYVVLVATRTPERPRTLDEVRAQVENAVLQNRRQQQHEAWLSELREQIPVVNMLAASPTTPAFDASVLEEDATDAEAAETAGAETAEGETPEGEASEGEVAEDETTEPETTEPGATGGEAATTTGATEEAAETEGDATDTEVNVVEPAETDDIGGEDANVEEAAPNATGDEAAAEDPSAEDATAQEPVTSGQPAERIQQLQTGAAGEPASQEDEEQAEEDQ
jgi:parvulin-like peptidyl-prolyl isomerase